MTGTWASGTGTASAPHTSLAYANGSIPVSRVTEVLTGPAAAASSFSARPTLALLELFIDDHVYRWRELRRALDPPPRESSAQLT